MTELDIERISIKRPKDSLDGKVIAYLRSYPFGLNIHYSQLITACLRKHWLPLVLYESGVKGEQLRQIGIWAICQLEAQIAMIERICGINAAPPLQIPPLDLESITKIIGAEEPDDEYEDGEGDDEGCIEMEQLPETIMANKALGFI